MYTRRIYKYRLPSFLCVYRLYTHAGSLGSGRSYGYLLTYYTVHQCGFTHIGASYQSAETGFLFTHMPFLLNLSSGAVPGNDLFIKQRFYHIKDRRSFLYLSFVTDYAQRIIFHDRIGIEFFADGTTPRMSPASNSDKDFEKQLGKRYHLLYGGAVLIRTYGALWLDVCAGYGWTGIMAWDEMENRLGLRKGLKGLSAGLGLHYFLGDYFFVSAGYNSIIRGFMVNRPDHNFYFGVGMRF